MDTIQKTTPNYARYTIAELEDVLVNIDRVKYAQRYEDAKAMLAKKLQERPSRSETEQAVEEAALPPVKWSEMHKVTRIVLVALLVQIFTSVPFVLIEFMAAKDWLQHTSAWYWSLTGLFSVLWFTSLIKDKKFSRHLVRNWSGKMAAAVMPLLFLMFSYITMDNTIPLILHNLN